MAATNRVDILDPAILRPGRFDRKIAVTRPDVRGREDILKVHTRNKKLADDVDLHEIARTTAGFAGADLENLMNESAINAAKNSRQFIIKSDIDKAFIKVGIGTERKSRLVPESERRNTAYHEAGHAILFHLLDGVGPVYTVSIIPTGEGAAGYTMPLPENDNVFKTKGKLLQDIKVSLGGRIAEEMIFDDITTGAYQDIKQATAAARAMVVKFGMSDELGLINYETDNEEETFVGRDIGHQRMLGEATAAAIDKEVKRIIDECYAEARRILEENIDVLHRCAERLLEKERIDREEFESLFV
jgi:cell division protease FtsH